MSTKRGNMNTADVLWRLIAGGVIPASRVGRACELLEVSRRELKSARARFECPPPAPTPRAVPVVSVPAPYVPSRQPVSAPVASGRMSRPYVPQKRYTAAGRRRVEERIFTLWREEQRCDVCHLPLLADERVVIDRAHHLSCEETRG